MTIVHSLIIPIYNEADGILEMYRRVAAVMDRLDGESELILIDDGSRDRSLEMMRGLANRDPRVGYLSLARNFGHQVAVTAGLDFARGRVIVILDADLQDPPELIPAMLERWREGNHVVYAQRTTRLKETWFRSGAPTSSIASSAGSRTSRSRPTPATSASWIARSSTC